MYCFPRGLPIHYQRFRPSLNLLIQRRKKTSNLTRFIQFITPTKRLASQILPYPALVRGFLLSYF
ncbi:hypothetical protein BN873_310014 [Candidatus Competibacter denitrificans Run_A_D11]|uniref:Uncharacterized protein n=1 Tax=Candidatus Competibacter denitrificans Run_A_D11 TaxID=1400863 RepID=W6M9P3_9GAMM|nr:hypothetical protein BN873_310014 [Candidatus Competibacter denitrificans Run_A_D11]